MFKIIIHTLWEFYVVLCHYTIDICTVSKFFYFFFWTAEDKIPVDKTGGGNLLYFVIIIND